MCKIKFILLFFCGLIVYSQTGNIKGKVIDKQSENPIVGAIVELIGSEKLQVLTDSQGNFTLPNIPVGRQSINIRFVGFENATVSDIVVTSGKDNVLQISLIEKFNSLDEVVISQPTKSRAINKMAVVSTKQFTVEEVNRFSGGRSDVARLVSNFAGVSTGDDSRNDIVVRGNSPTGMLWRVEGIPSPSPNHFSTLGTTGGPVSALNPNILSNSDFLTSAFPAEYGNAISGVFDLGFRKGNPDKYEFMISAGAFPGLEFMAEGPLGNKGGSFVVAARYGFVGFTGLAGTAAQPNYNDVSFNIDLGKRKSGTFSFFGINGNSDINFLGSKINDEDPFATKDEDSYVTSGFSIAGVKHRYDLSDNSYLKTTVGISETKNTFINDRYYNYKQTNENKLRFMDIDNVEQRMTFSTLVNSKINSRITIRGGLLFENFNLNANLSSRARQQDLDNDGYPDFVNQIDNNGSYQIIQPYAQGKFRLTPKLTLNAGLHTQYFSLNKEFAVEPRGALSYAVNAKNTFSFGYGMHHQNVAAPILLLNEFSNGSLQQTNKNLDLVESQHYVLGYDVSLAPKWRGKLEIYYQAIDKAAVENNPTSYSTLTEGADFGYSTDKTSLISNGKGSNKGVEVTLEKSFSNGYYAMLSSSIFESKYKGSDGIERNTPFNNRYVFNLLGGKEFKVGKAKKNVFSIDSKLTTAGGRYYTPVDLVASQKAGYQIQIDSQAFGEQYNPYLRMDIKFGMKINSKTKKQSHQFYVDLLNVSNNQNVFIKTYNRISNKIDQKNQIGFSPDFGYKFQF